MQRRIWRTAAAAVFLTSLAPMVLSAQTPTGSSAVVSGQLILVDPAAKDSTKPDSAKAVTPSKGQTITLQIGPSGQLIGTDYHVEDRAVGPAHSDTDEWGNQLQRLPDASAKGSTKKKAGVGDCAALTGAAAAADSAHKGGQNGSCNKKSDSTAATPGR